jgi:hypothetical protein
MITFNNIGHMGRFGNQMFQFASTVGIARKLGFDPVFPVERFQQGSDPNSYDGCKLLECFNIPKNLIKPGGEIPINHIYYENDFGFNPQTEMLPDSTSLSGYFQTEKYFDFIDSEIREIFTFRDEIIENSKNYINIENGVSLHVRRGDYLTSPGHHPTQTIEYYTEASKHFDPNSNFYIFSDDPEWCRQNLHHINNSIIVESGSPYIDMYLMSLCHGHIIANSSFSWWGSWLANSKKTVAPSNWFGPYMQKDHSGVYCKNWIVI